MILCCATAAMLFTTTTTTYLASYSSLLYGCEMSICSCTGIIFFKKKEPHKFHLGSKVLFQNNEI